MSDADVWKGLQAGTAAVVRQLEDEIVRLRQKINQQKRDVYHANRQHEAAFAEAEQLRKDLASERQTARLNAECHTREIRALQDMVEAEAEARREAEGEVERLRAYAREVGTALVRLTCDGSEFYRKAGDVFEVDPAACSAWVRRSRQTKHETIVRLTNQKNELQAELSKLRRDAEPPCPTTRPVQQQDLGEKR